MSFYIPNENFFTGAKKLHVAATFSYFYCGNAKKGLSCYKKLLSILRDPADGNVRAAEQQVLEQLIAAPSEAATTLGQIQQETMEALHQPEMGESVRLSSSDSFYYGLYKAQHNGCEAIAVHNAKILLGRSSTLSDTMKDFQDANAMIGAGYFGSNPFAIGRVLDSYCIAYQYVTPSQMTKNGVYIMSYWTDGAFRSPLHTIAVSYNGETYTAYNLHGDGYTEEIDINNYNGIDFICGYYLTDRTQRI